MSPGYDAPDAEYRLRRREAQAEASAPPCLFAVGDWVVGTPTFPAIQAFQIAKVQCSVMGRWILWQPNGLQVLAHMVTAAPPRSGHAHRTN